MLHGHADRTPSRPSSVVKDIDPIVEKVILRCLETEPTARPATALAVAAAMPGGDPLAAALAAGETPSPQLVAASGEKAGLRPAIAVACLAAILIGLVVGYYSHRPLQRPRKDAPGADARSAGAEGSRDRRCGRLHQRNRPTAHTASTYDTDFTDYVEKNQKTPQWDAVMAGRPSSA